MARSTGKRNEWTLSLLDIQRDDRILEAGCGPGTLIQVLAAKATAGDGGVFVGLAAAELTDSRFAMSAWAPVIAASMPINENSRSASESTATRA